MTFRQRAIKDQSYVPTSAELNEAIASFLLEHHTPDAKEVREFLMKENHTWRVPERRVRKFVKRQTQLVSTTPTASTDDDDKSVSSVRGRVKEIMRGAGRIFGSGSKNKSASAAVPVFEIRTTKSLLSPMINQTESTEEELLPPPTPIHDTPALALGTESTVAEVSETDALMLGTEANLAKMSEIVKDSDREQPAAGESLIYKDDNDGKKDRPCAPCEGCIVM